MTPPGAPPVRLRRSSSHGPIPRRSGQAHKGHAFFAYAVNYLIDELAEASLRLVRAVARLVVAEHDRHSLRWADQLGRARYREQETLELVIAERSGGTCRLIEKGSQHQRRPVSFSFSSLERRRPLSGIQGATGSLRSLPR